MGERLLFTTWEGGGHVAPALTIAARAAEQGAEVRVISDEANRHAAERLGLAFRAWRRAPNRLQAGAADDPLRDWDASGPDEVIERLCQGVICAPALAYAEDVREALAEEPADLVVTNELLFGAMMGAEAAGVRFAVLTGNLWPFHTREDIPPFGPGLAPATDDLERMRDTAIRAAVTMAYENRRAALDAAREALGLPALERFFDQLQGAVSILVGVSRAFDFNATPPQPFAYAGPLVSDPEWAQATDVRPGARPLVLISTSTLYQRQEDLMRRCIEAMRGEPVDAIATLGPALDPADFTGAPENVEVLASGSHDAIAPRCAAVISHAGHGTILRPLMLGVPLVNLPMGRDQPDNAARVAARGAGITLAPDSDVAAIRAALREVLAEPRYRENARAFGREIAKEADGGARAAEILRAAARG